MNDELIDGLRCCAESTNVIDECAFEDCPYHSHSWGCLDDMLRDAADAIEKLTGIKDKLILNICSHCDSHLAGCEDCPIIREINEVFNEQ